MHFMLETIIAAQLLGVDAFDQPAVEEGKVLGEALPDGRRAVGAPRLHCGNPAGAILLSLVRTGFRHGTPTDFA